MALTKENRRQLIKDTVDANLPSELTFGPYPRTVWVGWMYQGKEVLPRRLVHMIPAPDGKLASCNEATIDWPITQSMKVDNCILATELNGRPNIHVAKVKYSLVYGDTLSLAAGTLRIGSSWYKK